MVSSEAAQNRMSQSGKAVVLYPVCSYMAIFTDNAVLMSFHAIFIYTLHPWLLLHFSHVIQPFQTYVNNL